MRKEELAKVLEEHKKWLYNEKEGCRADLSCADLSCADLSYADLSYADLNGADLSCADLRGADLDEKEQHRLGVILDKEMTGYKKLANGAICELLIPEGSIVFCINGKKCRTNKAVVISGEGKSGYDKSFTYEVGKKLEIKDFNLMYNVECASGIHFFKTRKEAEDYKL